MNWLKGLFRSRESEPPQAEGGVQIFSGDDAGNYLKAEAHNDKGVDFFEGDNFDAAIREYRKAVEIFPKDLYYMNLGNALASKGLAQRNKRLVEEGIGALETALQMNPGFDRARKNLTQIKQLVTQL